MIRHIVALRFRAEVAKAEQQAIFDDLAALHLDGMSGFTVRQNVSPEEAVVHGFLDLFWIDFRDAAARDAYLIDPGHQAIGKRIVAATGGPHGVLVLDFEI